MLGGACEKSERDSRKVAMLHPQTIAAAVLAIVAALNGSDALDAQPARRVRPPRGQQYDFWFGTSKLTELKFQKKFRLSRDAFVDLTESIRGDLGKNAAAPGEGEGTGDAYSMGTSSGSG